MSDNSSTTAPCTTDGGEEEYAYFAAILADGREQLNQTEAEEVVLQIQRDKHDPFGCWTRRLLSASRQDATALLDQIMASASMANPADDQPKCDLVEFVLHLADQLDMVAWIMLEPLINSHFLRIIESALQSPSPRVVKAGHAALIKFLEDGLIQNDVIEHRIWPILLEKIGHMPDTDATLNTMHLMIKMTGWLGSDQTERVVVPTMDQLSSDPNFAVRRVCAQLYGDFCAVVSISCAEKLVPAFLKLCKDIEWVVRKTCAEVFMSVSSTVSLETRKEELAPAFEKLLKDRVRWVYLAAYQSLGPFITTFAEPSITTLGYNHLGELVLKMDGFESKSQTDNNHLGEELDDIVARFRNNSWRSPDDKEKDPSRRMYLRELMKLGLKDDLVLDADGNTVENSRKGGAKNGVELVFEQNRGEVTMGAVGEGEAILVLGNLDDVLEEEIEAEDGERPKELGSGGNNNEPADVAEEVDEDVVIDHIEEVEATAEWVVRSGKDENFNTFQFWREPLPNIDTELESNANTLESPRTRGLTSNGIIRNRYLSNKQSAAKRIKTVLKNISLKPANILGPPQSPKTQSDVETDSDKTNADLDLATQLNERTFARSLRFASTPSRVVREEYHPNKPVIGSPDISNAVSPLLEANGNEGLKEVMDCPTQDIVPQELIKHFVSMSILAMDEDYGNDLAHHCAYNLPAVVLTLGRKHWDILKPAYKALAETLHWKVRRTAASCIHELAVIVGKDVATEDLVPVFHGFIKDLDEVRVAALKHLAQFLRCLRPTGRNSFLPLLNQFLMMDNEWRWRFRRELAEQLLKVLGLFSPADTCQHLSPVVMTLLLDRVSDVRKIALQLATELVSHVSIDVSLLRTLLAELAEQFAHSSRWNRRQMFALFCSRIVAEGVLSGEMFTRDVLPHLLDLSWDRVPNVRLTVAKALATDLLAQPYFTDSNSPHLEVLVAVLKRLQTDKDKDVRYFACQVPRTLNTQFNVNEQSQTKVRSSSDNEAETKNL